MDVHFSWGTSKCKAKQKGETFETKYGTLVCTKKGKKGKKKYVWKQVASPAPAPPAATPAPTAPPTPAPVSCATGGGVAGTCVVGNPGPGGGKVFYVNESNPTGSRYMEFAPSGWNSPATSDDPLLAWGPGTTAGECGNLSIFTDTAIGTGKGNTDLITGNLACDTPAEAPAAWAAKSYTGGAVIWFLPSEDELNQVCRYASGQTPDATATTCSGNVLPVGGFAADLYWSSSQNLASNAWFQHFLNGSQYPRVKDYLLPVRPVRAF